MTATPTPHQLSAQPASLLRWIKLCRTLAISPLIATLLCSATFQIGRTDQTTTERPETLWNQESILAQALPRSQSTQQGNQISLNGRTWPAAWSQLKLSPNTSQLRIGISDAALLQSTGVDLLDTEDTARQPVQWFSQPPIQPLSLETHLTQQYRYLDITDLAKQANWQVQVEGRTLRISSPPARVLAIRQGHHPWGDRVVVDLDQPVPWQVDEQRQEVNVTLAAETPAAVVQQFQPSPRPQLNPSSSIQPQSGSIPRPSPSPSPAKAIKVETAQNQTTIRLNLPAGSRPRIETLPNPNRLIIDIRPDYLVEQDILWSPGLQWRQKYLNLGTSRFPVVWLAVNLRQPGLSLKPIWSNPTALSGTAPLIQTAQRWQAAAAINAGFFNRNNQMPLGAIRQDNRWISGPILNRGAIAWNNTGDVQVGRLSLQETLLTAAGQRLSLRALNSGYVQAGVARYTPEWGPTYTPLTDNELLVTVRNSQVVDQRPGGTAGKTAFPILPGSYVLTVRSNKAAADALPVGSIVRLESATVPFDFSRYPNVVGAGPLLLQNRQIVLDAKAEQFSDAFIREAAARSAIGRTADGTLLIVAVHNRVGGAGPTLNEIAQLMQQLGAVDALNLDGGSSTALYLGGQLLDRSPRTAARVHNGIGVFIPPSP